MPQLNFAFWDAVAGPPTADNYEGHIRLAQRVEELGWHSYFIIEHQNSPAGRATAPTVYLTAVARATSRLRIGAMIWQLPLHHPLRLAQEVAMLDQLSQGRVEFGTGVGVHEHEFIRWGADYYQRHALGEEVLDIVKLAWTQSEVTYDGKYFHFDEALPEPKPYQKPHPPIWAAAHSESSLEYAARKNYNVAQNLDTDEVVARKFDFYRQKWQEYGHAGPMPHIFLMRNVHVAETVEKAHEEARGFLATGVTNVGSGPIAETRIGWGTNARGMGRDSELPDNKERGITSAQAARSYEFSIENGLALVGSPETVMRKLMDGQQQIGYDLFCTNHQIGRMPAEMVSRSMELFSREVMPAFQPVAAS